MSQKIVEHCSKLLKILIDDSKDLSFKQIKKIVKELFIPIFNKDGYTINRDSMRRHDYLDYIASKGRKAGKQTIGVTFNTEETTTSKDLIEELVAGCTIDSIDSLIYLSNAPINSNSEKFDKDLYPVKFHTLTLKC